MSIKSITVTALLLLSGPRLYLTAATDAITHAPAWTVELHAVELSQLDESGFGATLELSAIANQNATLRAVVFDQVTVNGIPIRVNSLQGPIKLREGLPVEGLSSIETRLNFRELTSFDPLREIIRNGKAKVHTTARAQLQLNLFEKLAIFTGGAWVVSDIDQEVRVDLPGGPFGQAAAMAALSAAEPVWVWGQAGQEWRRNRSALAVEASKGMAGSLVAIETSYALVSKQGETQNVQSWTTGFLIGGGKILAPAEAVEPWLFDSSVARALGEHQVKVLPKLTEISASLTTAEQANLPRVSVRNGSLKILELREETDRAIAPESRRIYPIRFRANGRNVVVLESAAWKDAGAGVKTAQPLAEVWQPAAVYKIRREDGQTTPTLWLTQARKESGSFRLKDPLDATAFGSPVWIGGGVAGMLQTEDSAAEVSSILKAPQ
jgi:hypothetical protein